MRLNEWDGVKREWMSDRINLGKEREGDADRTRREVRARKKGQRGEGAALRGTRRGATPGFTVKLYDTLLIGGGWGVDAPTPLGAVSSSVAQDGRPVKEAARFVRTVVRLDI